MSGNGTVVPVDPQAMVAVKKKTQSLRSWILLDGKGHGSLLDVDKHTIMHRAQIHARDLRILDPLLSYPSTIMGREKAIVLNLEHIKAIITAEEVLLRDPSDENVVPLVEELQRRLPHASAVHHDDLGAAEEDESPFEFRALEVALEAICSFLAARTTELEMAAYPALDELTSKISSRNLDRVRKVKSAMTRLTARVQKVRDELEQLLDDDDDMADLYLTRKLAGSSSRFSGSGAANWVAASPTIGSKISRASRASVATVHLDENDVEELEMLLEAYFMQIDGTLNKLTALREYIDDTEDFINIELDKHRNQLIQRTAYYIPPIVEKTMENEGNQIPERHMPGFLTFLTLELFLSSGTLSLSFWSLICGIFGVNIPYIWNQDHGYIFKWAVIIPGAIALSIFLSIVFYARKKRLVGS